MKQATHITIRRCFWTAGLVFTMVGDALDFEPNLVRAAGAAFLLVFFLDVVIDPPHEDLDPKE